jgi:predicted permease
VVVIEVALALVLLVGGALLVRSFWQLAHVDPGFDPANVITARLWLPQPNDPSKGRYFNPARRVALYDEILRRARTLPGVSGAAAAGWLPLDGTRATSTITADGQETGGASAVPAVQATFASSGYFEVMGIRLLRGRSFTEQDDARAAPVVVITESMARQFWPGQDPIGRRVHFGGPQASNPWMTVIGVVRDVRAQRLEEAPRPALYRPLAQASNLAVSIVVKTSVDAATLGPALAREVRAADPDLPTYGVRTMAEIVAAATASRRFATQLVGGFGVVALLLAAVGVYGVMSFIVGQRAREMAIRIALGARPGRVVAAVLRQALALAAIGIGIGAVAAVQLTRLLRGLLFDVQPNDPLSFGGIAVLLAVAAVAAAWRPAAAAAGVDPMTALRME